MSIPTPDDFDPTPYDIDKEEPPVEEEWIPTDDEIREAFEQELPPPDPDDKAD